MLNSQDAYDFKLLNTPVTLLQCLAVPSQQSQWLYTYLSFMGSTQVWNIAHKAYAYGMEPSGVDSITRGTMYEAGWGPGHEAVSQKTATEFMLSVKRNLTKQSRFYCRMIPLPSNLSYRDV